jgi:hypothetical protein
MPYLFVTGSTGFLGGYLVRDLLARGYDLALLVRPHRKASTLFAPFLSESERNRCYLIEGDLTEDLCGINHKSQAWIAQNCKAILHCAASLKFQGSTFAGEPWLTNLGGTSRLIDLCYQCGIREFHFVSTAYAKQTGNDYEVSKWQAEQCFNAERFRNVTIYRPGIIVGDSKTGYTSSFTGFYAPLKLMSVMLKKAAGVASTREGLETHIAVATEYLTRHTGRGRKNYVPVDWVSRTIADCILHSQIHDLNGVHYLTPILPVPFDVPLGAIQEAFATYTELAETRTLTADSWGEFERFFAEGFQPYKSYFEDDPIFPTRFGDCPEMNHDLFLRCCRFAIESDFGRKPIPSPTHEPAI